MGIQWKYNENVMVMVFLWLTKGKGLNESIGDTLWQHLKHHCPGMKMTDDQYLENLPTLDDTPPRGPTHLISCDNSVFSPEGKPKNF